MALQALIDRAGGSAAFAVMAQDLPAESLDGQVDESANHEHWQCWPAFLDYLTQPLELPGDLPLWPILAIRPFARRLMAEGKVQWWKYKHVVPATAEDLPHAPSNERLLDFLRRFRCVFDRIQALPPVHLLALIHRARGYAAFNTLAAEVLTQPLPAVDVRNEYGVATWKALDAVRHAAEDEFLTAPPSDPTSPIAATLDLRPLGYFRDDTGRPHWWRRHPDAPAGWHECPFNEIFGARLELGHRFRRIFTHILGLPDGGITMTDAAQTEFALTMHLALEPLPALAPHAALAAAASAAHEEQEANWRRRHPLPPVAPAVPPQSPVFHDSDRESDNSDSDDEHQAPAPLHFPAPPALPIPPSDFDLDLMRPDSPDDGSASSIANNAEAAQ